MKIILYLQYYFIYLCNKYINKMNAKLKTKLDHLREAIREISKGYGGYFFSNKKTRKDLLFRVDGLTEGSLNRYIYLLREEEFLEPTLMGKGVHKVRC